MHGPPNALRSVPGLAGAADQVGASREPRNTEGDIHRIERTRRTRALLNDLGNAVPRHIGLPLLGNPGIVRFACWGCGGALYAHGEHQLVCMHFDGCSEVPR